MPLINGKLQPNQPGQAATTTTPTTTQAASPAATASSALGQRANLQRNAAASSMNKPGLAAASTGTLSGQGAVAQQSGPVGAGVAASQVEGQRAAAEAANQAAAGGNGDDASTLFGQDLLDQMKAGDAKAEESNAFRTKMMERQALAQAGRQNRALTGGGGQGMWMQANVMGQHLGDLTMQQRERDYNVAALDILKQRENNRRYEDRTSMMHAENLGGASEEELWNLAQSDPQAAAMFQQLYGRPHTDFTAEEMARIKHNKDGGGGAGGTGGAGLPAPGSPEALDQLRSKFQEFKAANQSPAGPGSEAINNFTKDLEAQGWSTSDIELIYGEYI